MATLALTITTQAPPWQTVPLAVREALLAWIPNAAAEEKDRDRLTTSVIAQRLYSPWTATLTSLALCDTQRGERILYHTTDETAPVQTGVTVHERSESSILESFWEGATQYDTFVTFNGRRFLLPFLLQRSALCGIRPTVPLLQRRYLEQQGAIRHIDLLDQVTYYGALNRRPSLALLAHAYGVDVSEEMSGHSALSELTIVTSLYQNWLRYQADIGIPVIDAGG